MSDITKERIAKPRSDEMSMDEILASIRKIISSEEHTSNDSRTQSPAKTGYQLRKELEIAQSAQEQLVALAKKEVDDVLPQNLNPYTNETTSARPHYQKMSSSQNMSQSSEHDAEILKTLNEIRESLNIPQQSTSSKQQKEENPQTDQSSSKNGFHTLSNDFDLKPAQFKGNEVPEFLKKFKAQQLQERTKNIQSQEEKEKKINYDFSQSLSFNDTEGVMELTQALPPQSLKSQETGPHQELLKIKQNTEAIIKQANAAYDEQKDLNDKNSDQAPLSMMIRRMVRPIIQEWLQENMPKVTEEILRDELRRGLK